MDTVPSEETSARSVSPFADPLELQQAVVDWTRALVQAFIARRPPGARPSADGMSALAVTPDEVESFISGEAPEPDDGGTLKRALAALQLRWQLLQEGLASSAREGIDLPLERLRGFFSLDDDELRLLLALFGPEVEDEILRAYRYAWNDFTRKTIEVGFLLDLLGPTSGRRDALRRLLSPDGPLRRHRLVELGAEQRDGVELPFLSRSVRLANRVVDFLRGDDRLDEALLGLCQVITPSKCFDDLLLPEETHKAVRLALRPRRNNRSTPPILLHGPLGVGKRSLTECIATQLGRPLVVCDLDSVFEDPRPTPELMALVLREASLVGGILYLAATTALPKELSGPHAARISRVLGGSSGPLFVGLTVIPEWLDKTLPNAIRIRMQLPEPEVREQLWIQALPRGIRLSKTVDLAELAQRYSLPGGAVQRAAEMAGRRAQRRSARYPTITQDDLEHASRGELTHKLATLAERILPRFGWRDFIMPEEEMERLKEIVAFARNRRKVFEDWGFDVKVPYGRGLSALFSGPPGTGKTMAAGIIARDLGLELFKVDLSRIVDRYIGETEKNLARMFDEATESHAVLLFDEADSLFSKRTAVRSSVDRYANLEVNYLLQRMESFEGVTILTTNFDAAFDEAFRRRIKFHISFPFPDTKERERLWKSMFPKGAKLDSGIDWAKLSRAFEMSGGHIKNAALRSAFLTAEQGGDVIREQTIWDASRFEYIEMGKVVRD